MPGSESSFGSALPAAGSAGAEGCPLCAEISRRIFTVHGYWVRECLVCGHRFAEIDWRADHVASVYGDQYFLGGQAGYPDYLAEGPLLRSSGRAYAALTARHLGGTGTVLDIGAAAGFILLGFQDAGWRGRGIEPNATMARYACEVLGVDVLATTLEQFHTDQTFDMVALIQVLAHLQDPVSAMRKAASLARPGGLLLVETWRRDSVAARVFGRRWHEYSPPSVLHWFSFGSLCALLGACGLQMVSSGRPRKRISVGHAASLIRYTLGPRDSDAARARPGRLVLPYPGDDVVWVLFRKPG